MTPLPISQAEERLREIENRPEVANREGVQEGRTGLGLADADYYI